MLPVYLTAPATMYGRYMAPMMVISIEIQSQSEAEDLQEIFKCGVTPTVILNASISALAANS